MGRAARGYMHAREEQVEIVELRAVRDERLLARGVPFARCELPHPASPRKLAPRVWIGRRAGACHARCTCNAGTTTLQVHSRHTACTMHVRYTVGTLRAQCTCAAARNACTLHAHCIRAPTRWLKRSRTGKIARLLSSPPAATSGCNGTPSLSSTSTLRLRTVAKAHRKSSSSTGGAPG